MDITSSDSAKHQPLFGTAVIFEGTCHEHAHAKLLRLNQSSFSVALVLSGDSTHALSSTCRNLPMRVIIDSFIPSLASSVVRHRNRILLMSPTGGGGGREGVAFHHQGLG